MRDLAKFGTDEYPLHPSMLQVLLTCPWRVAMEFLAVAQDGESGAAADTGSAMHRAAAAWHRGKEVADSIELMRAKIAEYPQADILDAINLFLAYAGDPRNRVPCVLVEHPVKFTIAPAAHDPTGAPIEVVGTLDQVRVLEGGGYMLADIKTSKRDPSDVLAESTHQQAAYMVGASLALGRPVDRAMLIMPRIYVGKSVATAPVFRHYAWRLKDTAAILEGVRNAVANIRAGSIHHVPNTNCRWCPMRSPEACLPQLQRTLELVGRS